MKEIQANDLQKTFLITGAAGFIGFHMSKWLLERGALVIGYDNLNDYYSVDLKKARLAILKEFPNFTFYRADLTDKEAMNKVFETHQPKIVINLAAQAGVRYSLENPNAYIDSNIVGFVNVLEMCRYFQVDHLLYASSSSVYGSNKKQPFSVHDRVDHPISLYAATKKSNELMAYTYSHLFNLPTTGLRFFTVYGPYGRPDMAAFLFLRAIENDQPIKVFNYGQMQRDFTFIDDIVAAVSSLISNSSALQPSEQPPATIYNVGNNHPEKLLDFIQYIEFYAGKSAIKELLPLQAGDVPSTYADIDSLIHDTGYTPQVNLKDGLGQFVSWYKEFYQ